MATKSPRNQESIGPALSGYGVNPPNPQDRLFAGELPILAPVAQTQRRDFREPVRPPLHYLDGPGPDEAVTSRHTPPAPLGETSLLIDHLELRPLPGVDRQPYAQGSNSAYTTNGVEIRGS